MWHRSLIMGTTDDEGNKTSALTTIGDNAFAGVNLTLIDAPALTSLSDQPFVIKWIMHGLKYCYPAMIGVKL